MFGRQVLCALLVLLLVSGAAVPLVAGGTGPTTLGDPAAQGDLSSPTFVITVYANGSARWTFQYTQPLNNETARENFEAFAADFENNSTELYRNFQDRARELTRQGSDVTGRQMNATAFSRSAYVDNLGNRGVVEMSFLWTEFAVTDGPRVIVGDVFEGGLYLGPDQRLRVEHGPTLVFQNGVAPAPDAMSGPSLAESDSLTWLGERQFTDEHPRVPLVAESAAGTGTVTTRTTEAPGGGGLGGTPLVALVIVLLLGAVAAAAWRTGALDGLGGAATSGDGGEESGGAAAVTEAGEGTGPTGGVEGEPAVPDEELMSDEDRVVRLLEENGGRMKQVNIVEETGWSKSKVSMLLSEMEEEDTISKLRVGRENVISLKGHEPDAAKSPFDEE